jgi:ABC-2 type transport system ATP-binding protein
MLSSALQSVSPSPQGGWNIPALPTRDIILQTQGLSKVYGKRLAVNGLNLEVARGEVFGFLGPNGAGKTTTIRMLLNLIRPTFGEVKLFGQRLDRQSAGSLLSRVGALIEQPAFQSYLSARDNLIAVCGYTGGIDPRSVDEVLGIVEMRELVRHLAQLGKTIFVSSHILAEVRQVCTRIGIVRAGHLIAHCNVWPESVRRSEEDLEHIFLRLTDQEVGL